VRKEDSGQGAYCKAGLTLIALLEEIVKGVKVLLYGGGGGSLNRILRLGEMACCNQDHSLRSWRKGC
jgi:F0F1-type ATP synthase beta subunit